MKIILVLIFLLFQTNIVNSNNNIVYLDVDYIIDKSDLGLFYKKKVKIIQDEIKNNLKNKELDIKEKETNIKNKKNILKTEELNKFINELDISVKEYQVYRNKKTQLILNEKKKYSSEILNILNPILTNFVEKNNIALVLKKKNVLVGAKVLDITDNILLILNEETKNNNLINEN